MPTASVKSLLLDILDPPDNRFATDPGAWITERLDEFLWSKQIEIAQSVVDNRKTAVRSCHTIGKSWLVARLVCWWLVTHPLNDTFVVTTAPTDRQVKNVVWREIKMAHDGADLMGRLNMKEWLVGNNQIVAFGASPQDSHSFQGLHAEYVLVLLDEACGVLPDIWESAESMASGESCRIVAVGNPTDPSSYFAQVCKPGSGWNVIGVSAFDTPAFTGEVVPEKVKNQLISKVWVEEQRNPVVAGEDTPSWYARVLGEFPPDSDEGVVRYSDVAKCAQKGQIHAPDDLLPVELGVDVGAGGDMSVIVLRTGKVAVIVDARKTPQTMTLVGLVMNAIKFWGATSVKIDQTGVGQGVFDRLLELGTAGEHNARIVGVMVGTKSSKPQRYGILRDQIWWEIGRELSYTGGWDLSNLPDSTINQLCAPTYDLDSHGHIKVEQKKDTRERLRRSPDEADALLLAFYTATGSATWFFEQLHAERQAEQVVA